MVYADGHPTNWTAQYGSQVPACSDADQRRGESESGGNENDLPAENENESGENEHEPDRGGAVRSRFSTRMRILSFLFYPHTVQIWK